MIFPARNLHLSGIFHGYVSHNQRVSILKWAPREKFKSPYKSSRARNQRSQGMWIEPLNKNMGVSRNGGTTENPQMDDLGGTPFQESTPPSSPSYTHFTATGSSGKGLKKSFP